MKEVFQNIASALKQVKPYDIKKDEALFAVIYDRDSELFLSMAGRESDIAATLATVAIKYPEFYKLLKVAVAAAEKRNLYSRYNAN